MLNCFTEKAVPVPGWVKCILIIAFASLMAISVVAGLAMAPEEKEIPVVLANGDVITPPWYITVDGERVALVKSRETAQEAVEGVIEKYNEEREKDRSTVLDIEVREKAETEKMDIKSGDEPPDILTETEAEKLLLEGNKGDGYLTVITTEEQTDEEVIVFGHEYKADPQLYVGESRIETEGHNGKKEVTKKVVKENGKIVRQEILEEVVLKEPQKEVILTGTKKHEGYGGGTGSYLDDDVSYDETAVYDALNMPVDSVYISSQYGPRWGRMHNGIDMALATGNAIYAADDGKVYFSGDGGGYGNLVKVDHGNGMQTYYAHCSKLLVSEGQQVKQGEMIALVGSTGNSTGPHLHFEVIINGTCVDPADFLDF